MYAGTSPFDYVRLENCRSVDLLITSFMEELTHMYLRKLILAALVLTTVVMAQQIGPAGQDIPFQVRYAANLNIGESYINITNTGANGASLLGPFFGGAAGNICVNAYSFSQDEQLIFCCSCLVTPNALVNLGVARDLTSNTLTQVVPNSVVVKLLATGAGGTAGTGTSCTNSAALAGDATHPIVGGLLAWGTTVHNGPNGVPGYTVTETAFSPATLSAGELASITGRCASIIGNGSGHGSCPAPVCRAGGLGASLF